MRCQQCWSCIVGLDAVKVKKYSYFTVTACQSNNND